MYYIRPKVKVPYSYFLCIRQTAPANYKPDEATIVHALRISHQGPIVEATVVLQLNQGLRKKRAVYRFFLDFSLLLSLHQGKESKEQIKSSSPHPPLKVIDKPYSLHQMI